MSLIIRGYNQAGTELTATSYVFQDKDQGIDSIPKLVRWYRDNHLSCVRIVLDIAI